MPSIVISGPTVKEGVHNVMLRAAKFHSPTDRTASATSYYTISIGIREGDYTDWIGSWDQSTQIATAAEPISHFTYQFIGTDGLIRYNRGKQIFELRNAAGTQKLAFGREKNFLGMYVAFALALESGDPGDLPTGQDGLIASHIAHAATEQLIRKRSTDR